MIAKNNRSRSNPTIIKLPAAEAPKSSWTTCEKIYFLFTLMRLSGGAFAYCCSVAESTNSQSNSAIEFTKAGLISGGSLAFLFCIAFTDHEFQKHKQKKQQPLNPNSREESLASIASASTLHEYAEKQENTASNNCCLTDTLRSRITTTIIILGKAACFAGIFATILKTIAIHAFPEQALANNRSLVHFGADGLALFLALIPTYIEFKAELDKQKNTPPLSTQTSPLISHVFQDEWGSSTSRIKPSSPRFPVVSSTGFEPEAPLQRSASANF